MGVNDEPIPGGGGGAGVLGALALAYDAYQTNRTARKNTEMTIAANKAEAELAYQRQVEMWNAQNLYNSPAQQMARFGAAGLNPNLIYGQGNAGNSSSTPQYSPPNIQARYEAAPYGAAVGSLLPTLMSVGTWMQNMRASEIDIQSKEQGLTKTQQLIDFLNERNPRAIQGLDNALSMYPYQKSLLEHQGRKAYLGNMEMQEDFRYKFGENAYEKLWFDPRYHSTSVERGDGTAQMKFLQELAAAKIAGAKSSWTDYNITDPQSFLTMLSHGIMGLTGQAIRINQKARPKIGVKPLPVIKNAGGGSAGSAPKRSIRRKAKGMLRYGQP